MPSTALDGVWRQQSRWSQGADRLKRDIDRWRLLALGCAVAGAVLSAAAVVAGLGSTGGQLLAFVSAAAVGLAGLARSQVGREAVRRWTRARSVSEAIKSEVYAHLALGGSSEQALEQRVGELQDDAADLMPLVAAAEPTERALPDVHDVQSYLRVRVGEQIDGYYRPRATRLARTLSAIRRIEAALAVAGVVVAAAAGTWNRATIAVWVPVITTVVAAVTAHAAAARYEYRLVEYLRTAEELDRIRGRRGAAANLSGPELVARAEQVISIQNEGWMAKLSAPEGGDG